MCGASPSAAACSPEDPCRARRERSSSPDSSRSAARPSTRRGKRRASLTAGAVGEFAAVARLLPCAYDASVRELIQAIETLRPEAVLMTGQAARRGVVCVERFARNLDDAAAPDNLGVRSDGGRDLRGRPRTARGGGAGRSDRGRDTRGGNSGAGVEERRRLRLQPSLFRRVAIPARHSGARRRAVFVHLPATPRQKRAGGEREAAHRGRRRRRR